MHDIVIIGAGPAGLTAAIYALRANKSVLVLEKESFGGQITYSPKVENYPGFNEISGSELGEKLVEQALDLGAEIEKPLYTSLIYELVNARISRGLPMIINSNLGPNDIQQRYQDRIWSRLFSMKVLVFAGNDVRLKLKKK